MVLYVYIKCASRATTRCFWNSGHRKSPEVGGIQAISALKKEFVGVGVASSFYCLYIPFVTGSKKSEWFAGIYL